MNEDWKMWTKIVLQLLPLVPALMTDIEGAIAHFKSDTSGHAQLGVAKKAVDDIGQIIDQLVQAIAPTPGA